MKTMVFSHGLDSSPQALKIQWLQPVAMAAGWQVEAPDYGDASAEARVDQLCEVLAGLEQPALVGSSLGGAVSVFAAQRVAVSGLFLMVPAVYWPGYEDLSYTCEAPVIEVVHAWHDSVVPLAQVLRWAQEHSAPMRIVNDDHVLHQSRAALEDQFKHFLNRLDDGG